MASRTGSRASSSRSVIVPYVPAGEKFACYKISKRRDEDISARSAARSACSSTTTGLVGMVRIAFGGMAATPKRAVAVEDALVGKPWTSATIEAALPALPRTITPLTDMRATCGVPVAGGAESAAAVPSRDDRARCRAADSGRSHEQARRQRRRRRRLHERMPHDSAIKHVAGRADYIDDLTEPEGTLHALSRAVDARAMRRSRRSISMRCARRRAWSGC